jgi:epoxyqueuosine reductase QueG
MSVEQEIKAYALDHLDVDMIGIAGIDRFKDSMPGRHPCDILPGAQSVIVFGVGLLDGAVQANFRFFEEGKAGVHGIYGTYGYTNAPNFHLMWSTYFLSRYIEKHYRTTAAPMPPGPLMNGAPLSMRHAAVAAGLGEFGWNAVVLTPEFGPRNRFGAIITQLALEPDPMYAGPRLCDPGKCQICVTKCPTGAISRYTGKDCARIVDMEGKHFEYSYLNWNRCRVACHQLSTKVGGPEDLVSSLDPSAEEVEAAVKKLVPNDAGLQHAPSWKCGVCITYCPAGRWRERYYDNGLTKGKHLFEGNQPNNINDKDGDYGLSFAASEPDKK